MTGLVNVSASCSGVFGQHERNPGASSASAEDETCPPEAFADRDEIAEAHRGAVDCLVAEGIVRGFDDETFRPGAVRRDSHGRCGFVSHDPESVSFFELDGDLPVEQRLTVDVGPHGPDPGEEITVTATVFDTADGAASVGHDVDFFVFGFEAEPTPGEDTVATGDDGTATFTFSTDAHDDVFVEACIVDGANFDVCAFEDIHVGDGAQYDDAHDH